MNMWDERYRAHETVYGTTPNVFWASQLGVLAAGFAAGSAASDVPGTAALPCDGEGRNAVAAAKAGWDVWSFDASEVGVKKSLDLAAEAGVSIRAEVGDAFEVVPGAQFDVVGLVFAHMPADRREEFHRRAWSWVKPGGRLVVEGFHRDQLGLTSGGPKDVAMLFEETTLASDLFQGGSEADGRVLWQARCEQILDEGPFHQGPAVTCQWVIQKNA
ncbi:MAG: SAM-dependent methyltransferase [Flavobacteriales bacterium]